MKKILLTAFFLLIAIPPAQARESYLDIREVVSPGGIRAWLVEDHSIPVIAVEFAFKGAGSVQDPAEKQGLSQLASNTMDEGAGDLDSQAFQKELRDKVITLRFSSGRDDFGGSLKTLRKNRDRAFELLKLALTEPRFDEEPVQRMRAANQSRIRASLTDPDWMAARLMNDRAFEGHPYALNSGGTLSSLENITPDDLRGFVKSRLGKNRLYVGAAGDITAKELGALLDKVFGALPGIEREAPPPAALQNAGETFVYEKDIPQTVIEMAQPGIDRRDPDYHAAQIMNFILGSSGFGSRLMEEIREKRGLTYGIYSYFQLMDLVDVLRISTSTANENVPEMLALIRAELEKMRSQPVTDKELADAKSYLIGSLPLSLTSTGDIAGMLLSLQLDALPADYLDRREEAIRNATAGDVERVAKEILAPDALTTILVGPKPADDSLTIQTIETLPNVE